MASPVLDAIGVILILVPVIIVLYCLFKKGCKLYSLFKKRHTIGNQLTQKMKAKGLNQICQAETI